MIDIQIRDKCVLCMSNDLEQVFELAETPIANRLPKNLIDATRDSSIRIPLTLLICNFCQHVQLRELVEPKILFEDYPYVSVSNETMKERFVKLSSEIIKNSIAEKSNTVLEIGSNDGFLLKQLQDYGLQVLGIDPAKNIAHSANRLGVSTIIDFFGPHVVKAILEKIGKPKVIIANNVLAHSSKLREIFLALTELMDTSTHLYVEFSYLIDVLDNTLLDTIYHEHTSYHHLVPLTRFLDEYGLKIVEATRFGAHGGSVRLMITMKSNPLVARENLNVLLDDEKHRNLENSNCETWMKFRMRAKLLEHQLKATLQADFAKSGQKPVGYGISAKFTTLYFGLKLDEFQISDFFDDNPLKIGNFVPGTTQQIQSSEDLNPALGQTIFLFAWNYKTEVFSRFNRKGIYGNVIVPLPFPAF
jgi:hypothetical protein